MALAHTLLVIIYYLIARRQPHQELGEDYLHRFDPQGCAKRLVYHLAYLGFTGELQAQRATAGEPVPALTSGS